MYKAIVSLLERYYVAWHGRGRPQCSSGYDEPELRDEAARRMASLMKNDALARDTLLGLFEQLEKAKTTQDNVLRNRAIVSIHNVVVLGNEYALSDAAKRDIQAAWYKATTGKDLQVPVPRPCTPPSPRSPPMTLAFSPSPPGTPTTTALALADKDDDDDDDGDGDDDDDDLRLDFYEEANEESREDHEMFETTLRQLVAEQLTQRQRAALRHVMYAC